jgi:Cd2+/Zn2+-exporting ATPase
MEREDSKIVLTRDKKFRRLIFSLVIVAVFEFLSLGGARLPVAFAAPFFAAIIFFIGWQTLLSGARALLKLNFRSINLLMVIAVAGAFYLRQFEEAAVVIVLFALGEKLEAFGIYSSKTALQSLVDRTPKKAKIRRPDGEIIELPLAEIEIGQLLVIKPSDLIALDAVVTSGASSVDESTITGEPMPRDKHVGDMVFAGTLNIQGYLEARVTKRAEDTTLAKIVEITFAATRTKARTQRFIERFSRVYTPAIIFAAALIAFVPPFFFAANFDFWFHQAITLLVIACPCALVISTPISIYAAVGSASKRGALVKGGKYIEAIGKIKVVALDKTRTLTIGKPKVTDVLPFGEKTREHLLACAAGIESYSEHPLANAIVEAAREEKLNFQAAKNFQSVIGKGAKAVCVVCFDKPHCIGKLPFISEEHTVQSEVVEIVEQLQNAGKTSIVISGNAGVEGIIALSDAIKPEAAKVVAELKSLGVTIVMLTGDNHAPALRVADKIGIREVKAELLPENKAAAIDELTRKYGAAAMVGDGVNDAPALATASVGIAMGAAGSDTAIETAAIALLNDRLEVLPFLVRLGRRALRTIKINTFFAVTTKFVFILLAVFGLSSLALAIFADVGVTILVILHSLRLLDFE